MKDEILNKAIWLRDIVKGQLLSPSADAIYPGSPCAFRAVTGVLPLIKNSICMLLGPEICLYNARISMSRKKRGGREKTREPYLLLVSDHDLIFGFADKLKAAVREVCSDFDTGAVFVVTTCLQEIIGEDFDSIIEELSGESDKPVIGIHTDNFTCDTAGPGLENTMLALGQIMKPQTVIERSVNLWGVGDRRSSATETAQMLCNSGIIINTAFPAPCSLSQLENAPAGALNIVMSDRSLPLAEDMQKRFGTPYVYCEKPYTLNAVTEMYERIFSALNIAMPADVLMNKERLEKKITILAEKLKGKKCVIGMLQGTQSGRYFNLAELFIQMGMNISGMLIRDILPTDRKDIENLRRVGADFPVLHSGNTIQNRAFLQAVKPDYYISGGNAEALTGTTIQALNIRQSRAENGFSAVERIIDSLQEAEDTNDIVKFKENYIKKWERK